MIPLYTPLVHELHILVFFNKMFSTHQQRSICKQPVFDAMIIKIKFTYIYFPEKYNL